MSEFFMHFEKNSIFSFHHEKSDSFLFILCYELSDEVQISFYHSGSFLTFDRLLLRKKEICISLSLENFYIFENYLLILYCLHFIASLMRQMHEAIFNLLYFFSSLYVLCFWTNSNISCLFYLKQMLLALIHKWIKTYFYFWSLPRAFYHCVISAICQRPFVFVYFSHHLMKVLM